MTREEWIKKYEAKAEKFNLLPGFSIYFEPDKGFFCWHVWRDVLEVDHTCTNDIMYMVGVANNIAKMYKCNLMRTCTCRDPVAYAKLNKGSQINLPLSCVKANGKMYWTFEREVNYE